MSNILSEEFVAALQSKILLKDLLSNDSFEKQFNSLTINADKDTVDKNDFEKVSDYLIQPEVLADMIDIMINESRSIMEPPLVLQLMMLEINPLLDAFVTSLPSFFQYLEKKTLNPRRLYFFQRLSQYLFEVRAEPCLHFAATSPDFIPNLIRHLSYAPIIQIFLGILTANTLQQSIDREKETSESANAPTRKQLIPKIVESLIISVESDLPGLVVGLYRLFGALTSNINLLQEILLTNDCSFIRSIFGQLNNPLSVDEAIGFLDDIFFKFVMQREKDADFFGAVRACLIEASSISPTLNANDIKVIIPRLRLIQSIVKHKVYFLLENETQFFSLISICYKFPWSNVLHCGIASVYVYILQSNEDLLSKAFLDANLVKEIVSGLGSSDNIGFRSHLRSIAIALQESQSHVVQNILKEDPLWPKVLEILKLREMKIPFPQIEQKVRNAFNILGTSGTWENENNKKEEIIIPEIPLFQEKKEEIQVAESLEEHNSEKKEEPILDFRIELTEEQIAERERRRLEILEEERRDREQAERRAQARELRRRESGILHLLSPRPHLPEEPSIMEVLQRDTENENKEPKEIENETSPVEDTTQPTTSSNEENTVAEVIQNEPQEIKSSNTNASSPDSSPTKALSEERTRTPLSLSSEETPTIRKYRRCRECFKRAPTPDAITCEECDAPFQ